MWFLTSFLLISLPHCSECLFFHCHVPKNLPPPTPNKKNLQNNLFQASGLHAPQAMFQRYNAPCAVLAPYSMWWHHHSSVITVLYLPDIQHRYHDNRKRTVQSVSTWVSPPTQAHSRPTHRWPCHDLEHMDAHPEVRAQTGCLQQAHLLPMGSAASTVLLTIQIFSSAALFVERLL